MDTKFWGPSGWKLLHSIAMCFDDNVDDKRIYKGFFSTVRYVLPCIYCRRSYSKFLHELKIDTKDFFKWTYKIHNKVNDKLKKQGYNSKKNPKYSTIYRKYSKFVKKINCMLGWDFIYSIIFNYPQYSYELSNVRYNGYIKFFHYLKYVLPCKKIRESYSKYITQQPIENNMEKREDLILWCYNLEKYLKKRCCSFENRCKRIEKYRVNKCSGNSCRK
jgi:hypothetical protein